jgi:non-canonical purine NTP pyrophosphatase (RdgB/HAM1 family)
MTDRRKIVLASRNEDKIRELRQLCNGLPFEVASSLDYPDLPEVIEDGTTIQGNASRKALVTAAYTGEIAVADDTALQIRVLDELPDVFASRFASDQASYEDNAQLVLDLLAQVPEGFRQARFVTSMVWADPRPERAVPPDLRSTGGVQVRWLHNPFARAIHVRDPQREAEFWGHFVDRRRVWEEYRAERASFLVNRGWTGSACARSAIGSWPPSWRAGDRPWPRTPRSGCPTRASGPPIPLD